MNTVLKIQADDLWRKIVAEKFEHRCFICRLHDSESFHGIPHSSHHMIKRRFLRCAWDVRCGCYLCAEHHEKAEASRTWLSAQLNDIYLFTDRGHGNAQYNIARSTQARMMFDYIEANSNPKPIHLFDTIMADIVIDLDRQLKELKGE